MSFPLKKLTFVAVCGLWACGGMVYLYDVKVSEVIVQSPYCKEAMKLVRQDQGAKLYLGDSIKPMSACFDGSASAVKVYVLGSKTWGTLFLSLLEKEKNKYLLDGIQLQIAKDDSRRLIIKESSNKNITE